MTREDTCYMLQILALNCTEKTYNFIFHVSLTIAEAEKEYCRVPSCITPSNYVT